MSVHILFSAILFTLGMALIVLPLTRIATSGRGRRFATLARLRHQPALLRRIRSWPGKIAGTRLRSTFSLAGQPLRSPESFQAMRLLLVAITLLAWVYAVAAGDTVHISSLPFARCALSLLIVWYIPYMVLVLKAKRRKTVLLFEIARLSHRLTVCMSEKADLRDILLRAGRTSRELKPILSELATDWNKNQYAAIVAFGERVGITEAYPLVNTLLAASQVEVSQVAAMLQQQVESIDKSIEYEILKKIENVPLFIVFLIMIPFMVVFVLMIYPWMTYMSELLFRSF